MGLCSEGLRIGTNLKVLHSGNLWGTWGLYLGGSHGGIC